MCEECAAKAAEIALLKEGRTMHDELADHLEHELAQQAAEIEKWKEGTAIERELRLQAVQLARDESDALIAQAAAALEQIALEQGRFNQDPFTHARNCIEDMKELARAALAAIRATLVEKVDD